MTTQALNLAEWDDLKGRLDKLLTSQQQTILEKAGTRVGARLDQITRDILPPSVRKQRQPFKTARQRRWWWATMHKKAQGKSRALPGWKAAYRLVNGVRKLVISGGYRRTGKLVQSLAYRVTGQQNRKGASVTIEYGTNRDYARWVIDREKQSKYHKGNWRTLQVIGRAALPQLKQEFLKSVMEQTEEAI